MKRFKIRFRRNDGSLDLDMVLNVAFLVSCLIGAAAFPGPYRWAFVVFGCIDMLWLMARSD